MTADAPGRLVLARHAESEGNVAGVWQGQSGLGLTCRGQAQAAALADRLLTEADVVAVVCSDQRRVLETAAPLAGRARWAHEVDARWRELDVGAWSGRAVADVREHDHDRFAAFWEGRAPAGGDGETIGQLRARVRDAVTDLDRRLTGGGTVIVVTHGWALRAAVGELTGLAAGQEPDLGGVGNAALCVLQRASPWEVVVYDDRTHLPTDLRARPGRRAA